MQQRVAVSLEVGQAAGSKGITPTILDLRIRWLFFHVVILFRTLYIRVRKTPPGEKQLFEISQLLFAASFFYTDMTIAIRSLGLHVVTNTIVLVYVLLHKPYRLVSRLQ